MGYVIIIILSIGALSFCIMYIVGRCNGYEVYSKDVVSFNRNEYLEDVEREMLKTRHSSYPVTNQGKLVGSVSRYHLLKSEKKKFILVDHNEKKQSIS